MSKRFVRCPHCGLPHDLGVKVCPSTGKRIEISADGVQQAPKPPKRNSAFPLLAAKVKKRLAPKQPEPVKRQMMPATVPPPAATSTSSLIGKTLGDKYKVVGLIGEGGMGTVYEAVHMAIGRSVAIKVLNQAHLGRKEAVARFNQEARAAGGIGHPNICEIYDVGQLVSGSPYLVMERLKGQTLADRIAIEGALPFSDIISILTQVLSALFAAHEKGIIHRDIKPENIFLTERVGCAPVAKILDFGISKSADDEQALSLTRTGMVMGTPYYMAPEQARGENIDHRIDIYACGVILYETLTGRRPFIASNYNALVVQVLSKPPPNPQRMRPAIPDGFLPILDSALAKKPQDRFNDARGFIAALASLERSIHRGPNTDEIQRIAQAVRRGSRPAPPLAVPHRPITESNPGDSSDSIEIPITFEDTGSAAKPLWDDTTDVLPESSSMDDPTEGATEIGSSPFLKAAMAREAPEDRPITGEDEVNDTIVDPSGDMLAELWGQMQRDKKDTADPADDQTRNKLDSATSLPDWADEPSSISILQESATPTSNDPVHAGASVWRDDFDPEAPAAIRRPSSPPRPLRTPGAVTASPHFVDYGPMPDHREPPVSTPRAPKVEAKREPEKKAPLVPPPSKVPRRGAARRHTVPRPTKNSSQKPGGSQG